MNKEELMNALSATNDEQKNEMVAWLRHGEGHSVAPLDYFTSKGIPLSLVESMKRREWSNFIRVPEGVTKVALDYLNGRPIGFVESEVTDYNNGWFLLLRPQEEEKGYLSKRYEDAKVTKRVFVEGISEVDYDDWDEIDDVVEANKPHPQALEWHRSHDEYNKVLTIDYKIPITPELNYEGEENVMEVEGGQCHYLVQYDGQKRIEYINANKVAWHKHHANAKPITKKAAMDWVRGKLEESPEISSIWGSMSIDFRRDGKRRPMKDIANDYWLHSRDEIDYHQRMLDKEIERCPEVLDFLHDTDCVPEGWRHERLFPMGYTDVMWNNNFMVPWVDGVSSTGVISAIKNTLEIEGETNMMGRGSHARALGEFVINFLQENNILESDNDE